MGKLTRRMIDERGRIFGKVSVIDLLVIIMVLVMVVGYVARNRAAPGGGVSSTFEVLYTISVLEVRVTTERLFRPGDTVYDEHGVNLGVIRYVGSAPARVQSTTIDGSHVMAPSEERVDVFLRIAAQCSEADGHIFADRRTELSVDTEMNILTKYVKTTAFITSIDYP